MRPKPLLPPVPHSVHGQPAKHTIAEVAQEFDLTPRALRFYEEKGLLSPERVGRTRLYDDRQKQRLSVVVQLKNLGFTVAEVCALLAEDLDASLAKLQVADLERQVVFLERRRREIERSLAALEAVLARQRR